MNILDRYLDRPEIFQYNVTTTDLIPFSPDVVAACRANACGKYGTCWTCPPGVGTLEEQIAQVRSYRQAAVFTCKVELEDCFDFEGMMEGQKRTMELLRGIRGQLTRDGIAHRVLGCGACGICERCTYPEQPCRFPELAIGSVEACGINVVDLAKRLGLNYNNGADTVTYFCLILFG